MAGEVIMRKFIPGEMYYSLPIKEEINETHLFLCLCQSKSKDWRGGDEPWWFYDFRFGDRIQLYGVDLKKCND
jgi:hypothetical protein